MQIILPQTDIEQALKNFIRSVIQVRDGMDIIIDLKAGRGPNGFEAMIDITPAGESQKAEPVDQPEVSKPVRAPKAPAPIIEDKAPVEAKNEQPANEQPVDAQPVAPVDEVTQQEPATEKKSLFAGVRKPVNS